MSRLSKLPRTTPFDTIAVTVLLVAALVLAGKGWLADHPEHDPSAPLDLRDPRGMATEAKLAALLDDPEECRAVLERSEVAFTSLDPVGEGECRRADRLTLDTAPLSPGRAQLTCPVAVGLALWVEDIQPLAEAELGSRIERIEQMGTYSCRRIGGGEGGNWSEHATGNAIDLGAFVLDDGQRISVLGDWDGGEPAGRFLRAARDSACDSFGTVLSPDYNAAHADHLHLDQGRSPMFAFCR